MHIYILTYLLDNYKKNLSNARSACTDAKEREKNERKLRRARKRKGIDAQRVKHPTSSQASGVIIGDEEQNEKQKRT